MEQKKLCVIGDPVEHSLSPVIHNTILRRAGLPYEYGRVQVKAGDTEAFLRRAIREGYAGFNATMPHKTALVELADELDADAKLYRAVNTVVLREGKIRGCNTDGRGFLQMLTDSGAGCRRRGPRDCAETGAKRRSPYFCVQPYAEQGRGTGGGISGSDYGLPLCSADPERLCSVQRPFDQHYPYGHDGGGGPV